MRRRQMDAHKNYWGLVEVLQLTTDFSFLSRLASLRCAHATQTSWLQNIYCSIVHYVMLWGGTHDRNRRFWGTSCMATWRSWGGQLPSWGQQASPPSVRRRRRRPCQTENLAWPQKKKADHSSSWDGKCLALFHCFLFLQAVRAVMITSFRV